MGRNNNEPPKAPPTAHTAIILDPVDMWSKPAWDFDQFSDIQRDYPEERQPLAYAALNICIAATSLRNWVESIRARNMRRLGLDFSKADFAVELNAAIPEQGACEAIANTAKHARFNEANWPGGKVRLLWLEGDEDAPAGFVLYHCDRDGRNEEMAFNRFSALVDNWWAYLSDNALAIGAERTPQWQQNKLKRIFPPIY